MKRIILTGGGTAGHVTPNMALIPTLKEMGYDIHYIGSYTGIEKGLIEGMGIPYHPIATGKLRRYFDVKNFSDPIRVVKGFEESKQLMRQLSPDVIFSKGGFVSVPVVLAASHKKLPIIIHESDMTPGLANKIALPHATRICCNFPETAELFPEGKAVVTGTPIRKELYNGNSKNAFNYCGFTDNRPTILVIGGSTGSAEVNNAVWGIADTLVKNFNVIHICGKGKTNDKMNGKKGYVQYEYVQKELPDMFALADLVISRAGANAICELLALKKPNILIPLSKEASRGDQILNAESFEKQGYSKVIMSEDLNGNVLLKAVNEVIEKSDKYISAMEKAGERDAVTMITDLIEGAVNSATRSSSFINVD